jgi:hypothetical protein
LRFSRRESTQLWLRICDNYHMAKEEEEKQAEEDQPPPETLLEQPKQRDPDEAVLAEQAIHEYAEEVLNQFRDQVENALADFAAWAAGQKDSAELDNPGFFEHIGHAFLKQMTAACGGKDTPIGAFIHQELDGVIDQAVRDEEELGMFVSQLSSGARDFTWSLRDNLQSVLSGQWDQLRDLAYEGSTDFISAIHAFGLPQASWKGADMKSSLVAMAEHARDRMPKTQEEARDRDPKQEEEEQEQTLIDEEEKKQQVS